MNLSGYTNTELLFGSEWSEIYRIYHEDTGVAYVLKTPGPKLSVEKASIIYQSEFDIASKLDSNLHLKYIACGESKGKPYLLTEDFGAVSLAELIPPKGFDISTFFIYALKIVSAIAQLHQKKIIHKDICSSNIAVNQVTGDLKLIDFGSSSNFSKEICDTNTVLTNASLAFISPEQTGRINSVVSYKTDFYSLGVTFFHMLSGRLPFPGEDSSELIYQHIAAEPPHAQQINPSVPAQLDRIVYKLMGKNPDTRYSSAFGLLSDMEKSLRYWDETHAIPIFQLAETDVSEVFSIPEKLYGREKELIQVREYFDAALTGEFTVCYIVGQSGIGKSAVVTELYKDIVKEKGNFGFGKFDQFKRNLPYSALIQALNQIIQKILIESAENIARWKFILLEALGNNVGLLISVLPDLELIMGKSDNVEIANPSLAKNRFVLAFKNLIKSFSQPDAPLVLFLDDLQWIDSATLQLFADYFNTIDPGEKNYTLLIGAYRDNEVGPEHPLDMVLRDSENRGFVKKNIKLAPLQKEAINQLCSEALGRKPDETIELVSLIHLKTGGSPFFIIQFLENLYDRGFIYLNPVNHSWTWQLEKVEGASFTENVVDFIQGKLHKLDPDVQLVLKIASCLGQYFEASDIVNIAQTNESNVNDSLVKAMEEDIIYKRYSRTHGEYRFQHDRIQNAANNLIGPDELEQLNYKIGMYFIQQPEILKDTRKLFEGLGHINRTEPLVKDDKLRLKLARYNLEAAKIARQSIAYQAALTFADMGIQFMSSDKWLSHAILTRDLHLIGTQCAYLIGEYEKMHQLKEQALPNLSDPIDKANFHEIVTYAYASRREWTETVEEALRGLAILGLKLSKDPNQLHVMFHLSRFFMTSGRKKPEDLINLPELKDTQVEAMLKLFISAASAAYMTNQNMFAIFFIEMARLSAKYGNCKYSAFGYIGFGVFYGGALGFINYGYRFGELGKKVFEKYRSDELLAKNYFTLYAFIQNWKIDVKELYPKLMEGFQIGSQVGENEYAAWCLSLRSGMSTLSGENLEKLEVELLATVKYSENLKQIQIIAIGFLEYCEWWQDKGLPENDPLLEGFVDHKATEFIKEKFWTGLAEHDMMFGSMHFYYFQYKQAWTFLSRGWKYHESLVGLFYFAQLVFYRAWTAIKLKQEDPNSFSTKELNKIINDFKKWAIHSSPNHGHKLTMFEAELAVLKGEKAKAMNLFDEAIAQAEKTDHPNDQALFCEITARHYQDWGKNSFRDIYIRQAYNAYLRWGAIRKSTYLENTYPDLKLHGSSYKRTDEAGGSIFTDDTFSAIDFKSIIKASQAISGEMQVDTLMSLLLKTLNETAGAQRVIILLNVNGKLRIEALKEINNEVLTDKIPLDNFTEIPVSIINFIEKTKNTVLLENACDKGNFTRDPYIMRVKEKSVLAIPIVRQSILEGIIYLNNNLATGIFTTERADMLTALGAQVAISLENINFIGQMQELNKSYHRFVPKEFLKMLDRESILDVIPGDQKIREMIIMFADIRNFTTLCETIPANETFSILNEYLTSVTTAIHDNGGVIDKFMGDGIMAIFPNDADLALRAAVQMQQAVVKFNQERKIKKEPTIHIGIGLHIGTVILGTVGTDNRLSTTVLGDPVNLAARLESHTKINKTNILVSGELEAKLKNPHNFNLREVGHLIAKGKTNKIKLVEEYSIQPDEIVEKMNLNLTKFRAAIKYFERNQFAEAGEQLEEYLKTVPTDEVASHYLDQCYSLINS